MKILFVGAGNMGGALLSSALNRKILNPSNVFVLDKSGERSDFFAEKYGCQKGNPGDCEILLLAVKPQNFSEIFPLKTAQNPLILSVMAGIGTQKIQEQSGAVKICRTMPNTPAMVGRGMTGVFFTSKVPETDRAFCEQLFGGIGSILEIDNEDQMHAITALSGSGPAYFFHFVECLSHAGQKLGLSPEGAQKLAEETFFGSAELLRKSTETPEELRKKVTSPGGTTFAALENLEQNDFSGIIEKALFSAEKRSRELGK